MSQEKVFQMTKDIAKRIEKYVPIGEKQTIEFNERRINLILNVVDSHEYSPKIYSISGGAEGQVEEREWKFEIHE